MEPLPLFVYRLPEGLSSLISLFFHRQSVAQARVLHLLNDTYDVNAWPDMGTGSESWE